MSLKKSFWIVAASLFSGVIGATPGDQVVPPIAFTEWAEHSRPVASAIAMDGVGKSLVVYVAGDYHPMFAPGSLVAKLFRADGTPDFTAEFAVATPASAGTEVQNLHALFTDDGKIRIVWQAKNTAGDFDIRGMFINNPPAVNANVLTLSDTVAGDQTLPSVALDQLGHLVLSWSNQTVGGYRPMARIVNWSGSFFANEFELSSADSALPVATSASAGNCCGGHVVWIEPTFLGATSNALKASNVQFWSANTPVPMMDFANASAVWFDSSTDMAGNLRIIATDSDGAVHYRQANQYLYKLEPQTLIGMGLVPASVNSALYFETDDHGNSVVAFSQFAWPDSTLTVLPIDQFGQLYAGAFNSTSNFPTEGTLAGLDLDADGDVALLWRDSPFSGMPPTRLSLARYQGVQDLPLSLQVDSIWNIPAGGTSGLLVQVSNNCAYSQNQNLCAATGVQLTASADPEFIFSPYFGNYWACETTPNLSCHYERALTLEPSTREYLTVTAPTAVGSYELNIHVDGMQWDSEFADNSARVTVYVGDADPDNLSFAPNLDVPIASQQVSNPVTLSGMQVPAGVRFNGPGEISINGGAFEPYLAPDRTVSNGDVIQLRHEASWSFASTKTSVVMVAGTTAYFSSTTQAQDSTPDAFAFADVSSVPRSSAQTASMTVSGINASSPASIVGGEFSIDGGAYSAASRNVLTGAVITVRHTASAAFATATHTTLTVGGVSDTFSSSTEAADTTPNEFAFNAINGAARSVSVVSTPTSVAGINAPASIAIIGGEYSVNGAAFTNSPGTVNNADAVVVRHTSAADFSTTVNTTLTIGGVAGSFSSTTEAIDISPNAFAFIDQTALATNVQVTSAVVTIQGINAPTSISVSAGAYSINGGAFVTSAGTVNPNDTIRARVLSAATANTTANATITVGGVSAVFSATTGTVDSTPNAFTFTDVTGARKGRLITSNTVTLGGINSTVPISIAGGMYSKNGGAFTSAAGTVVSGDRIRLQLTASNSNNTAVSSTVSVGGIADVWTVTSGTR